MGSKQVAIEIMPDRVDIVVLDGERRIAAHRVPLTLANDAAEWVKSLSAAGSAVNRHVKQLQIEGRPATVFYRSPTQAIDLSSTAVNASQAESAATLNCLDSLSYSTLSAVCEAAAIGRDAVRGKSAKTHVVVAADREDVCRAIVTFVENAGLKFDTATPLDAAIIARTTRAGLKYKGDFAGLVYIGEHSSFIVMAAHGSLMFERRLSLGLKNLADALTRPIRNAGGDQTPIELPIEDARAIVQEFGFPEREAIVDHDRNLKGGQILPLLQPPLQRFIVELRQSLRFGLSDEQRASLKLKLVGPGSRLPQLADIIASELGVDVSVDENYANYDIDTPASIGSPILEASKESALASRINLMPKAMAEKRKSSQLKRWLWTGGAAAMAFIGVDTFDHQSRLDQARNKADAMAVSAGDIDALRQTAEQMTAENNALAQLEKSIEEQAGGSVSYWAAMQELTLRTPQSVRLNAINFTMTEAGVAGRVTGFAEHGHTRNTDLHQFITAISDSPLFDDAVLGDVQIGELNDKSGERFEAKFKAIVAAPESPTKAVAQVESSPSGEASP